MVVDSARGFKGPSAFARDKAEFKTARLAVSVDEVSLCFVAKDALTGRTLTRTCPDADMRGFSLTREGATHAYGLGQQFVDPGVSNGDWMGRVRESPGEFGNVLQEFKGAGGALGDIQMPIVYLAGKGRSTF